MFGADVTEATGEHDRLVIAADLFAVVAGDQRFIAAEVTENGRTAKLVVKGSATQRPVEHDIEGGDNALRLAEMLLPRLFKAGNAQVGDRETHEAGLGLGADASGAFVADLTTGAGGCTRPGADGSRVVVGFHLAQHMNGLDVVAIFTAGGIGKEAPGNRAFKHRGVILVGREHIVAVQLVGVLDHLEQRFGLFNAVDGPLGVEDLVAAMFRVGLGEHIQLDVVGVAPQLVEAGHQVIDLVFGQRQPHVDVGLGQRLAATLLNIHAAQWRRLVVSKERLGTVQRRQHRFHHAVVDEGGELLPLRFAQCRLGVIGDAAFDTLNVGQATVVGDVGGLGGPGRNSAGARHHQQQATGRLVGLKARAVAQQALQTGHLRLIEAAIDLGKVNELGIETGQRQPLLTGASQQFVEAKGGERGSATKDQHGWGHICGCEEGGIIVKSHFVDKAAGTHRRRKAHLL